MVMLAMLSPFGASARMPGMLRSRSPIERGAILAMSASRSALVEVALSSRSRPLATPVEKTSATGAFFLRAVSAGTVSRSVLANAGGANAKQATTARSSFFI